MERKLTKRAIAAKLRWIILIVCTAVFNATGFAEKPVAGLSVNYSVAGKKDSTSAPNVWLYVANEETPSPFLPAGKFDAVWSGFISADLRGDYSFQAELNGALKLEINGQIALDAVGTNSTSEISKLIRLNKGTNSFVATFSSSAQGDAFVRLNWKPKDSFVQPIPLTALSHFSSEAEQLGKKLRLGRELFVEHRCAKCHVGAETGMPELAMDAPSFENIGARRNFGWMARWIADPKSLRTSAHMPQIFSGENSRKNAEVIAAFLASLNKDSSLIPNKVPDAESGAGKKLFETLRCVACHDAPDIAEVDAKRISLKQVRAKFAANSLVEFLKQPDANYSWIRMPRFKLSDTQRDELAAFLNSNSEKPSEISKPPDLAIESGKKLLQTSGCLNCHTLKLENQFATKSLAQISNWKSGCLSEKAEMNSKAPRFRFSDEERDALQLFCGTDRNSLKRHVPAEFAERQSRSLNCTECHGKIEGIPPFEILGGKLRPEWAATFIAGEISDKPRPWLESQMPAFSKRAQLLAEGLAMQHGFPPRTPTENSVDKEAMEIGRKLVSVPPLGFSCVSCHSIGKIGATQVFEAPGINLASSGERLQPKFFKRWLRNPPMVDPLSKMPVYFDEEGKSPLTDVYGGDGEKQIEAVWQYILHADKEKNPPQL